MTSTEVSRTTDPEARADLANCWFELGLSIATAKKPYLKVLSLLQRHISCIMEDLLRIDTFAYNGAYTYDDLEFALTHCRRFTIMYGPGVLETTNVRPLHGPGGLWSAPSHPAGHGQQRLFMRPTMRAPSSERNCCAQQLLAVNRQAATEALPTVFYQLLAYLFQHDRLDKSYTTNPDCLENKVLPMICVNNAETAVIRVLGSNEDVMCDVCDLVLPAAQYQADFLENHTVPCPRCSESQGRRSERTAPILQPAVTMLDEIPDSQNIFHPMADDSDMLLLVGIPCMEPQLETLVKDMARMARQSNRRVVYIGLELLPKLDWSQIVNVHLRVDPLHWAERHLQKLVATSHKSRNGLEALESFFVPPPVPFKLGTNVGQFLLSGSLNDCRLCFESFSSDVVNPCRVCHIPYCMQGPDAPDDTCCVHLFELSPSHVDASTDMRRMLEKFHSVCPAPCRLPEPLISPSRLVVYLFYIHEFWYTATYMVRAVAYTWNERGWPCRVVPISLDDLAHNISVDVLNKQSSLWNYRSYQVFALYLTHALTPSLNIQTSATHAELIDVVIDMTLTAIQPVLSHAASLDATLLCCGHLFKSPQLVGYLQHLMSQWPILENIVGCLNTRLPASVTTSLLSSVVMDALGYGREFPTSFVENWMRDEMASSLTDLILFSQKSEPIMYCFAPMQTRPLGRPLPSVLHTCGCKNVLPTAQNMKKE
ncbi:NAD-dependent histone deacetylase SIR2 [Ceratobasidium sp. AG-Ba]|nr:NAD-dependent histone deacetylase SIR2 [Ceratobasidium sp. AG-Ba]QRW12381.1 NAD-dependent histone deacetylase SIR2 [Ceratobasidium sp. AG-Ba]